MTLKHLTYGALVGVTAFVIAIGSATTSEAKSKKKAAAAPAPVTTSIFCIQPRAAVCAKKGNSSFTYANACYAAKDGAKDAKAGACKEKKAAKKGGKKKMAKKGAKAKG